MGRNRFYQLAQDRSGVAGRIASAFCQGHAGRVCSNYSIYAENKNAARMPDIAIKYYSDDDLHGFGESDYALRTDGKTLLNQQRGLIIPLIENAIDSDRPSSVLEIGTGNGDVLAFLASKYPSVHFIGADLSTKNASGKHNLPNLEFVSGYALDLLAQGQIKADVVFGTSTFVVFAPLELRAYLAAMKSAKRVIISDPVTFGNKHEARRGAISRHMDLYMWWHNYYDYLVEYGFEIKDFRTVRYSYSHNPNCDVVLISGKRTNQDSQYIPASDAERISIEEGLR
jgi:hypothetical protein